MSVWRVIITDTEYADGVAPVCDALDQHAMHDGDGNVDAWGVYDCCPGPFLRCGSERQATVLAECLTIADAGACT